MDDTQPERKSRRGGGRGARREARVATQAVSAPYLVRKIDPIDILSEEACQLIEENAETCLLYTSPSPRDNRTSRMPSSA